MMNYKAISKTLLIVAIVVIAIAAGIATRVIFLQSPLTETKTVIMTTTVTATTTLTVERPILITPTPCPIVATIDLYIGATPGAPKEGDAAQLYLIVTPANQKFKVGDYVKIVLHNNNTWPNPHAFSINVGGVSVATISASVGKTAEIMIRLDRIGVYTATCITFCGVWHTTTGKMVNVPLFEVS
jgi:heme/copper-type cytochrome/quinol oxidase subunit 2